MFICACESDTGDNADCFYMIKELPQSVTKDELMAAVFAKGSYMRGIKRDVTRLEAEYRTAALTDRSRRASYNSASLTASYPPTPSSSPSSRHRRHHLHRLLVVVFIIVIIVRRVVSVVA